MDKDLEGMRSFTFQAKGRPVPGGCPDQYKRVFDILPVLDTISIQSHFTYQDATEPQGLLSMLLVNAGKFFLEP